MDIVTLGAALNGSAEYVNSHFKGGSNIQIVDNSDGTQTINASGEVSSEDTVARAEIAAIKDGETLDSFGDVETALAGKVDKVTGKGLSTNDYTAAEKTKLAGIEAQANKTTVDDALSGSSTNPVQNKVIKSALDSKADTSDIPTVPITAIQKNGTGITPVSGTVNITVPTQASDINAATAMQGVKADTAIQGIKVNSSTVNPDSNKVVSITVPTSAADVSALPDTTKYAVALSLTINSSTYVMTGQLKDQNGDNLGTAQTIDLPLESVVVGGSYNSQTKKVVLTLQNGNTIEFSVADLVSGLQTELSASNKLNPAYIDYDSTHRAVSDTEKSAWNGKQDTLSSAQLAAVNSGIDSTKVAQIETNKNNISTLTANGGGKNKFNIDTADIYVADASYTKNSDGTINVTKSTNTVGQVNMQQVFRGETGTYIISGCPSGGSPTTYEMLIQSGDTVLLGRDYGGGATVSLTKGTKYQFKVVVRANQTLSNKLFKPMISVEGGDYQPYALSNAELTEEVNTAKNNILFNARNGVINMTNISDTTLSSDGYLANRVGFNASAGTYRLKSNISGGTAKYTVVARMGNTEVYRDDTAISAPNIDHTFTLSTAADSMSIWVQLQSETPAAISNTMVYPAAFGDIPYLPYAMSNAELTAAIQALQAQLANQ